MANKAIAPHSLIRIFVALFLLPFICRSSHILSQDTSGYGLDSSFGHGVDILETEPMIDRPSNDNDSIPGTSLHPQHQSHVFRRDFTCGPGQPCSNSACCGASGFCGYGELRTPGPMKHIIRDSTLSSLLNRSNILQYRLPVQLRCCCRVRPVCKPGRQDLSPQYLACQLLSCKFALNSNY